MMSISAHAKRHLAIFTSTLLLVGGINLAGAPPAVSAESATLVMAPWQFKISTDARFRRTNTDEAGWADAFVTSLGVPIIWADLALSPDGSKLVVAGQGGQLVTFNGTSWAVGRQLADIDANPATPATVLFADVTDVQISNSGTVTVNANLAFEPVPHSPNLAQTYFDRVLVFSSVQPEPEPEPEPTPPTTPTEQVVRTPTEDVVRVAETPTASPIPTPTATPTPTAIPAPTPAPRLTSKITLPASSAKYCSVKPVIKNRSITAYRVTSKQASRNGCRITLTMATKDGTAVLKKLFIVPTKSHRNKKPTTSYIQLSGKLVIS